MHEVTQTITFAILETVGIEWIYQTCNGFMTWSNRLSTSPSNLSNLCQRWSNFNCVDGWTDNSHETRCQRPTHAFQKGWNSNSLRLAVWGSLRGIYSGEHQIRWNGLQPPAQTRIRNLDNELWIRNPRLNYREDKPALLSTLHAILEVKLKWSSRKPAKKYASVHCLTCTSTPCWRKLKVYWSVPKRRTMASLSSFYHTCHLHILECN